MLLQLVSSIDGRLKSIETAVDSIKDIKRELLLMSAKMRELEFKVSEVNFRIFRDEFSITFNLY
jgi:hypothetical protein